MATTVVGVGTPVANGIASATQLVMTANVPAGALPGDRVYVMLSFKGGSALAPSGWQTVLAHVYPGLGTQPAGDGARMHAIFYRDFANGWTVNDRSFIVGADFNGQTAAIVSSIVFRKNSNEEWQEPYIKAMRDTTVNTTLSAALPIMPFRPSASLFALDTFSTPMTLSSPSISNGVASTPLTLGANTSTTLGDDVAQVIYYGTPPSINIEAVTHVAQMSVARPAEVAVVVQDVIDVIDNPIVESVTAYNNKFDPRTGNTGEWMGADVGRSIPFGDGRFLWIFADTFWRPIGSTGIPTSRAGYQFHNSSLGFQDSSDLATANVTFHRGPGNTTWFPIAGGTHYCWPIDGLFIDNDLYVFGQRVLSSNPMGAEYGWTVHRIVNAKITPITSWPTATLLYQSGDTGCRPLWSAYDGGDGYIYSFGIARNAIGSNPAGWRTGRWLKSNLTGTGQATYEWWNGTWFGTGEANSVCIAENPYVSEGSGHRRSIDGRWILTEGTGFGEQDVQMRLTQSIETTFGTYTSVGPDGYRPPPPGLQPGDHILSGGFNGKVLFVLANGDRVVKYFIDNSYSTVPVANLTALNRTDRFVYRNPRMDPDPGYVNYACKAHPDLTNTGGLIASYADNSSNTALDTDLSVYWPKFIRVKAPVVSNFAYNSATGSTTWSVTGAPDIQLYRVNGGAWTSIDPLTRSMTVAPYADVELVVRGLGGDTLVRATSNKFMLGDYRVAALKVGANGVTRAYIGDIIVMDSTIVVGPRMTSTTRTTSTNLTTKGA